MQNTYETLGKPALQFASTLAIESPQHADALVRYAATHGTISGADVSNVMSPDSVQALRVWAQSNPLTGDALQERVERGRVLFQAERGSVDNETAEAYHAQARAEGFDVETLGGERAMLRMLRAGIMPADVPDSIESGRVFYDFDASALSIDGSTE